MKDQISRDLRAIAAQALENDTRLSNASKLAIMKVYSLNKVKSQSPDANFRDEVRQLVINSLLTSIECEEVLDRTGFFASSFDN